VLPEWVVDEMETVDLGDKRLNRRMQEVLTQLAARPTASIPAACGGGRADMEATYRLFANEKATFTQVLQPHIDATERRIAEQSVVILAQDTTEIDLTRPEQQVVGAGPLDGGSRWGVLLHEMQAFTPDGTPLGTVHSVPWARERPAEDEDQPRETPAERRERLARTPIEEQESYRWVVGLRRAGDVAQRCPRTQVVCVADSEADIYELLVEAAAEPQLAEWIVRACQNRALQQEQPANTEDSQETRHLREALWKRPVLFAQTIAVRGRVPKVSCDMRGRRQPRQSRKADVEVRAARLTLRAPRRSDRKLPGVSVNAVLVREVDPPAGEEPVEWLLLTSLPIDEAEQVRLVVQYYCVRWMVEVFFRVLKGGCRVEDRRFEHVDRLLACLAVYLAVSWRTLYVCRLGREFPDMDCESLFEPSEWKSVYYVVHRRPPPTRPPTLAAVVRMVAQLGGYVHRQRHDPPGPQTVWLGMQRLHDITLCWDTFGPGAKGDP
jgi:Transposase DNA-binding/Transposase Tn5 dimerisation domain